MMEMVFLKTKTVLTAIFEQQKYHFEQQTIQQAIHLYFHFCKTSIVQMKEVTKKTRIKCFGMVLFLIWFFSVYVLS